MLLKTLNHTFNAMSVKTAKKDGSKYLGKNGTQAWRVSALIEDEWYAAMIYDEDLLPVKGKEYHIELSENEGFLNWAYKLKSKKEQILEQTEAGRAFEEATNQCCEGGNFNEDHMCRRQPSTPPKDPYEAMLDKQTNDMLGKMVERPTPPKDDVQERIIKGMCFNNTCVIIATEIDRYKQGDILETAKGLHKEMYLWLTS